MAQSSLSGKVHVMHLRASNFVGGPERQILEHVKRAENDRFHLSLCCFLENKLPTELETKAGTLGLGCCSIATRSPFDPRAISRLVGIIREKNVRILVTHGYKPNIVGRFASWFARIPVIAVSRGWTYESPRVRIYETLDRFFLRMSDCVVAVSQVQRDKIVQNRVHPDRVQVIHNAIDLEGYPGPAAESVRAELGVPDKAVFVVSAGRLSPEKNQLGLVEAAKLVCAERDDVYFAIFGEGVLRGQLEQAIAVAGLQDRFFLPGFRNNVRSLLHEADIFALPSHTEGLPNVVLEAFACKKPVVATAVGGTPEVVRDRVSGFLVPKGDMVSLANAVLSLAGDAKLRVQMGMDGFFVVADEFGFERQTEKYLKLYGTVGGK
jgi:glycosyltransferase involved in cell wall biosynthesis